MQLWNWLFDPVGLTAHGFCLSWSPALMVLHAGSDAVIALSYFSIPFALGWLASQREDFRYGWVIYAFGAFILACGATHAFSIVTLWVPAYGIEGVIKFVTAILSVTTAIMLWPLVPRLVALPSTAELARLNNELRKEVEERRRAEEALRLANQSIESKNRELEAFSYSVAHDLRAPLRGIDGFSQVLLEDYGEQIDAEGRSHLGHVRRSAQHMAQLIDDLLSLARVSRAELRLAPCDLVAIACDAVAELRLARPDVAVTFVCPDKLPVLADPGLMSIVLANLLSNAWKFTRGRKEARIELGCLPQADETVYFIRDNGVGFNMAYQAKLFVAFQRLHAPGEFEGTGIGLATVSRIIQRHGGQIWAEAQVGQGATFYFTIGERR
jgi:signal transduction histidine kinase